MIYLLDANVLSDLMTDQPGIRARAAASRASELATSVIAVGEIYFGLERLPPSRRREDLTQRAHRTITGLMVHHVAAESAPIYAALRQGQLQRGAALDGNDLWIAATAIYLNATLVTRDSDFSRIPGMHVEDWTR